MSSNTLIVFTHPNHESLNYSFLQSAAKGIKDNNTTHLLKIVDLYSENFNPSLNFDKEKRRRDLHQDPETKEYRNLITWADHIVFIYPIWWGRPPAMLLGFFDRVFTTNFAYRQGKGFQVNGLLKGKQVTCISTMKGPTGYPRLFLKNSHKILMEKAIFNFCGIKKAKFFEFGSMETDGNKQEKALKKVHTYFSSLSII